MINRRVLAFFLAVLILGGISLPLKSVNIEIPWSVIHGWEPSHFIHPWAEGVVVDDAGSIYTTGSSYLWNPALFGFPTPMITLNVYPAPYVAKWNKKGKLIWYTLLASTGLNGGYGTGIDVDRAGNIYVTGMSYSEWDSGVFGPPLQSHNGLSDGFVAKLDPSGTLLWHTFLGGSGYDHFSSIDVTGSGGIAVAGESDDSWNTAVYGDPLIGLNEPGFYTTDIVVARLNKDGELQWYTFLGGDDYEYASAVKIADGGSVFIAGQSYLYWPEFKYGRPLQDKIVDDQYDGLLAKLSPTGAFQWYTFLGGEKSVFPSSMDHSQMGKLFLTGVQFDSPSIVVGTSGLLGKERKPEKRNSAVSGFSSVYIAAFSFSGEKLWEKTPYVAESSGGTAIDIGPLGDLFVCGSGSDAIPFPPNGNPKADLFPSYFPASFVLCMDQTGNKKWLHSFKAGSFASAQAIAAFDNGITYLTGNNWGGILFISALESAKNGVIRPVFDPGLFILKINCLYTVETLVKTEGGVVEQDLYEVVPGKDAVINIFPDPGFEIDKIIDNNEDSAIANPYIVPSVNEDHMVEVYFRLIRYPPELLLTGTRTTDNSWLIEKEFASLTATITEHETHPMEVKAYILYKYINGEWKEITRFTGTGVHTWEDKFLMKDGEAKYILKAIAPDGTVLAESDILIL